MHCLFSRPHAACLHWPLPPLQGLFERHKLLVATQLCMRILKKKGDLSQEKFDYLLRGPHVRGGNRVVLFSIPLYCGVQNNAVY